MAGETIMSITYGLDVQYNDDPYIMAAERGVRSLWIAAIPGAFLVDMLPFLKYVPEWFPGAGFRSEERRVGKECNLPCRYRWSPYH